MLVIDLDAGEVVAAYGIEGLDQPVGLAMRGTELYLFDSDGTVSIVDKPTRGAEG